MGIQTARAIRSVTAFALLVVGVMVGKLLSQNLGDTQTQVEVQAKVARALAAGTANIVNHATVAEPTEMAG
jgi:uncharacterized protein YejL (UPF0352 family)